MTDFNDACYTVATDLLAQLTQHVSEELEREVTMAELGELLTWAARDCSHDLVADAANRDLVIEVRGLGKRKRVQLVPGDVVEIPDKRRRCFATVYLGKFGTFGHALGACRGTFTESELSSSDWAPAEVLPYPSFVDMDAVALGRWKIAARRPDLIDRFNRPEYFHHPDDDVFEAGGLGEFGLAEDVEGNERPLTEAEFNEVGLADRSYEGAFLDDRYEAYLRKKAR